MHTAVERTLRQLQDSEHRDDFSVRGAWSFAVWLGDLPRSTRGLDLVHHGRHADPVAILREVFPQVGNDALIWDGLDVSEVGSAWTRRSRIRLRTPIQDVVVPLVVDIAHHVGAPLYVERLGVVPVSGRRFLVNCMSKEWLFAEKCALLVTYGPDHTRLQDLFDLLEMSRNFQFQGTALCEAFQIVASSRDAERMVRRHDGYWEASLDRRRCSSGSLRRWEAITSTGPGQRSFACLQQAIAGVRDFVWPILDAVRAEQDHPAVWRPGLGWGSRIRRQPCMPAQLPLPFDTAAKRTGRCALKPLFEEQKP
ncbi:nucleotidyl transferase AbiEii/AbiGii toxin family protein [Lichenicoccus roseus]